MVWESSNPAVLSIDKFGVAKAHKQGTAEVTIYSWDDAQPLTNNGVPTYRRDGVQAKQKITVF